MLLALLGFVFVSLLVAGAAMALSPTSAGTTDRRIGELTVGRTDAVGEPLLDRRSLIAALKRVGTMAPRSDKETGKLQQRLITAGFRGKEAIVIFFGIRIGFALVCFAI